MTLVVLECLVGCNKSNNIDVYSLEAAACESRPAHRRREVLSKALAPWKGITPIELCVPCVPYLPCYLSLLVALTHYGTHRHHHLSQGSGAVSEVGGG